MYFQILKLIVWPKFQNFPPRIVEFETGKVNVITGISRTGKSAIIPIIDYCLASSDCSIPIETIRNHASWYGLIVQTKDEQLLIARKVPEGNKPSNDFFLNRGKVLSVPEKIQESNEKSERIKHILNDLGYLPYFNLGPNDEQNSFDARLGFRDLMAFVFQNQDLVANQNILFYKTHEHEHRERLRNWFPFIIGAETIDTLRLRQKFRNIDIKLRQLRKEYERLQLVTTSWVENLYSHLKVAVEYGLIKNESLITSDTEELLNTARKILINIPEYSITTSKNVLDTANELTEIEEQESKISLDIAIIEKRLNDLKKLKSGLLDYGTLLKKRTERLHISQWLKDVQTDSQDCAMCGGERHINRDNEIEKISLAFQKYEEESKKITNVPTSFDREEERLQKELDDLFEYKKSFENRHSALLKRDDQAKNEFQTKKSMFLFLGHLEASLETFEKISDNGELKNEIEELEKEYNLLSSALDREAINKKIEAATTKISQKVLENLKTLDVEEKYREVAPTFDIKNLNIKVLSSDGNLHFLAEVGSASNWVSFHVALMCALQEYFIETSIPYVPSFVIFDQPSQVYFPKLSKINEGSKAEVDEQKINEQQVEKNEIQHKIKEIKDVDVEAVKKIFATISESVKKNGGLWQSIILDHADKSIYGEIEGVVEIESWTDEKKLIPNEWYDDSDKIVL